MSCRRPGHGLIAWPPATSTAKWKTALTALRRVAFPVPLGRLLEGVLLGAVTVLNRRFECYLLQSENFSKDASCSQQCARTQVVRKTQVQEEHLGKLRSWKGQPQCTAAKHCRASRLASTLVQLQSRGVRHVALSEVCSQLVHRVRNRYSEARLSQNGADAVSTRAKAPLQTAKQSAGCVDHEDSVCKRIWQIVA